VLFVLLFVLPHASESFLLTDCHRSRCDYLIVDEGHEARAATSLRHQVRRNSLLFRRVLIFSRSINLTLFPAPFVLSRSAFPFFSPESLHFSRLCSNWALRIGCC
jgi:hypothetical protein